MKKLIETFHLYAWVAEDEKHGLDLQRALTSVVPVLTPLVDVDSTKCLRPVVLRQLRQRAAEVKKPIRLVRFQAVEVIHEIEP